MAERVSFLRDDPTERVPCARCGEPYQSAALDRLLWCERCRIVQRNRAGWWGWLIGFGFAGCVAAYVWFVVRPTDLVIGGWLGTLIAATWIGSKVGREVVYGVLRARTAAPAGRDREG